MAHAFEGEFYRWRCTSCEEMHDTDIDPRGDELECEGCGKKGTVLEGGEDEDEDQQTD